MNKFSVTLNIGENLSTRFGAVVMLIKTNDPIVLQYAVFKAHDYLQTMYGIKCVGVKTHLINKEKTENTFVVGFEAITDLDEFTFCQKLDETIGMLATLLYQEAIAYTVTVNVSGYQIAKHCELAGLYKYEWNGGVFDSKEFITLDEAENAKS